MRLVTAVAPLASGLLGCDGPWEWEAVLDDLEAVIDHFGLADPAVVGHSLGGMVAGMWTRRHPDCPAAVSLDGHRSAATHADKYAGTPPDRVRQKLQSLSAMFTAQAEMMAHPLSAEQVDTLLDQQRAMAAAQEVDDQLRNGL
jgi:pimeloyl-ACP methyl ester carboxylesterase